MQTDRSHPTTRTSLRNKGPIIHCLNPACSGGGYDVTAVVREMPAQQEPNERAESGVEAGKASLAKHGNSVRSVTGLRTASGGLSLVPCDGTALLQPVLYREGRDLVEMADVPRDNGELAIQSDGRYPQVGVADGCSQAL